MEMEYMAYLKTPRTSKELCEHFDAATNAVLQMLRTLRLKNLIRRVKIARYSRWAIVEPADEAQTIQLTPLQYRYLNYLREPRSSQEMVAKFDRSMEAVQQLVRSLRLMGLVESVAHGSPSGHGGCWHIYKITPEGARAIDQPEKGEPDKQ